MAAGRLQSDAEEPHAYFEAKGWWLFDPGWIREQLGDAINAVYTDSVAVMTAKILLRGAEEAPRHRPSLRPAASEKD